MIDFVKNVITSRGGQLASRCLGVYLVAIAAWIGGGQSTIDQHTQSLINEYAESIAAAAAGFVALAIDLWTHRRATGGVFKPAAKGVSVRRAKKK